MSGLFCEHPLQATLHHVFTLLSDSSDDIICPICGKGDAVSADAEPKSYYCYRCAEHFMRGVQP